MRHLLLSLLVTWATVACENSPAAAPPEGPAALPEGPAAPPEGPAALPEGPAALPAAAPPEGPAAPPAAAPPEGPALPEGPAAPSPWASDVHTTLALPGPAFLTVAAAYDGDRSTVWAQPVTAAGVPAGPAVDLRATTGKVDALAAAYDGVTLWVGWRSVPDDDAPGSKSFVGLGGFDLRLTRTQKVQTLRFFDPFDGEFEPAMRMVARPGRGAGAALATPVGTTRCKGMFFAREGYVRCPRISIDIIEPDGTLARTEFRTLDGGDPSLADLLEVGEGVVTSFHAFRGGPTTDVAFVPYAADQPVRALDACDYAPVDLAWVDGGVLSVCPDIEDGEGPPSVTCRPDDRVQCGVLRHVALDGTSKKPFAPATNIRFDRVTRGCKAGQPILRIEVGTQPLDVPADALDLGDPPVVPGTPCEGPALE